MATKKGRSVASFFAGLFIISAIAFPAAVVFAMYQEGKTNDTSASTSTNQETKKVDSKDQLQGKPLAGFTPVASIPELQKQDTKVGTGTEVKAGDTVTADYTGAVAATGIVFQSSKDSGQPVSFPLDQVIAGWSQGVPGRKEGGTRRLVIPAALAYGANSPAGSNIPANADLVFDVTVYKVGK